jgi:hypothetical protein
MGKNNQSKYYYCARCQRAVYVPNFRIRKVHLGNDPHGQTKWEFTCWGAVPFYWWRRHRQQVDSPLPPDDPMVRAAKVFTMGMTPDDPQFAEVIQARALAREAAAATDESADPPEPTAESRKGGRLGNRKVPDPEPRSQLAEEGTVHIGSMALLATVLARGCGASVR